MILFPTTARSEGAWDYPAAPVSEVVDNYHGTLIPDPYRPLEDPDSQETIAWVEAQNRLTESFLNTPEREKLRSKLTKLWNYPRYSTPTKRGGQYFFTKNDGLQNQAVLHRARTPGGEAQVILDPNTLSEDGTVALTGWAVSEDGKWMSYALSSKGSDSQEVHVRSLETGEDLPEILRWCKFTSMAWKQDASGFFYNRFPEPGTVPPEDENNYSRVYWHALGTPQSEDPLIHEDPADKELGFHPFVTDDGKYLTLHVTRGTDPKNRLYYREVEGSSPFVRLLDAGDAKYDLIDNLGPVFLIHTDLDAPRGRVIAIDLASPARENWKTILPQSEDTLDFVLTSGGKLVASYLRHAHHVLRIFSLEGSFEREMDLPALGSVSGIWGRREDPEMFFGLTSFLFPTTIHRYAFDSEKMEVVFKPGLHFDPEPYETRQVFAVSKDGTRFPMFLTHKKGLVPDGTNPTLLYGYGGFNATLTPYFSVVRALWMEAGGVFAMANTRGGGEYGEEWHQAGILGRKQNLFDDFIAAAEWLIQNKVTNPSRLAIEGGSNGGLLVAACMLQRPDLFGAVLCGVPVIDMLRYHKFTVGRYWTPEYGNAEADPEHFKFLRAYSPLHNVRAGAVYPPILITSADTDDRVAPLHSKKFAATLQAKAASKNPILLRVETRAGHGGGKPTAKVIAEVADEFAFLFKVFDLHLSD
ncbi:MAG: S9 family peptidase [Candidatus Omnitrophica bacterium]|nr:S9 family peptidase [Candidatus Omnitrophota bacterium]